MASQMQQQQPQQQAAALSGVDCPPPAVGVNGATPPQQFLQTALVDPSGEAVRLRGLAGQPCLQQPPRVLSTGLRKPYPPPRRTPSARPEFYATQLLSDRPLQLLLPLQTPPRFT